MLHEDAKEMTEYVSQAMIQASQDAAVLLYATGMDTYFEEIVQNSERAWYFDEAPREKPRIVSRANPKMQRTLETFT
jgi:hypothetical protein